MKDRANAFRPFPSRQAQGTTGFEAANKSIQGFEAANKSIQMDWPFSKATSSLAYAALRLFTKLTNYWRTVLAAQGGRYRPELHYMRGPGPKWRKAHVRVRKTR